MKKRVVSIIMLVVLTLGSMFTFAGCDQIKYGGKVETPVYDEMHRSMLVSRIKELDGLNNLQVAQMYDINCYIAKIDGEVVTTTKYSRGFEDAVSTEKVSAKAMVDISNYSPMVYDKQTLHRGIKQYLEMEVKTEEARNDFKEEGSYNDRYVTVQGRIEGSSKTKLQNWVDTSEVAYDSDLEIQTKTWTYTKSTEKSSSKTQGNSHSEETTTTNKAETYVTVNKYASIENMLAPFITVDEKASTSEKIVYKFKDSVMVHSNGGDKYKLTYSFTQEDGAVSNNGFLGRILGSFSCDTHYTTYEAILIFGEERGQYDLKVTIKSNMNDNTESETYGNYYTDTKLDITIIMESNNDTVELPSEVRSYREN